MIISHKFKFIFFSNPKTGSESIRALLEEYQEEAVIPFREHLSESVFYPHMSPIEARKAFTKRNWNFDEYFRFVFTRNPYARMPSVYEMIKRNRGLEPGIQERLKLFLSGLMPHEGNLEFKYWLKTIAVNGKGGGGLDSDRWRKFGTYSVKNYVADEDGNCLVDTVIRLEHAHSQLPVVFAKIGLPVTLAEQLQHINKHGSKHYAEYYDSESRRLVATLFEDDIRQFSYTFQ